MAPSNLLIRDRRGKGTDLLAHGETQGRIPSRFCGICARRSCICIVDPRESQGIVDPACAISASREGTRLHFRKGAIIDIPQFSHPIDQRVDRRRGFFAPAPLPNLSLKVARQTCPRGGVAFDISKGEPFDPREIERRTRGFSYVFSHRHVCATVEPDFERAFTVRKRTVIFRAVLR